MKQSNKGISRQADFKFALICGQEKLKTQNRETSVEIVLFERNTKGLLRWQCNEQCNNKQT